MCFRTSDITVVVIATMIFCGACALVEKQLAKDKQESLFSKGDESQSFDSSVPALSQMNYEVLGSSGFSITDFMQNANFSDSIKMKVDNLSKDKQSDKGQFSNLLKIHTKEIKTTSLPIFSKRISQRMQNIHFRQNATSSEKHFNGALTMGLETTEVPTKKLYNASDNNSTPSITLAHIILDSLYNTNVNASRVLNYIRSLDFKVTTKDIQLALLKYNSSNLNRSNFFPKSTTLFSKTDNQTLSATAQEIPYLNGADEYVTANKTPKLIFNLIKLKTFHGKGNCSTPPHIRVSNCIKQTVKLFSDNNAQMKSAELKLPNKIDYDSLHLSTTNSGPIALQNLLNNTNDSKNATLFMDQIISTGSLTQSSAQPTEELVTDIISINKETSKELAMKSVDATKEIHSNDSKPSNNISSIQLPSKQIVEPPTGGKSEIRITPSLKSEFSLSSIVSTLPAKSIYTELNNSSTFVIESITPLHATPSSTEKPQMLVNVSGQIRIIRGMIWMYQLNDKESVEYQYYSRKVQRMLEEMFWQTWLAKHIKKINVYRFRRGSVMVDFRLAVKTERHIQPQEMELLFNSFLLPDGGFGGFQMDRHFTKFKIFEPVRAPIPIDNNGFPQWATALIVVSGASLIFVILFVVVTVYGNYPIIINRNHRRIRDEEYKGNKVPWTDWERKAVAAYENLSADGIYNLDEVNN